MEEVEFRSALLRTVSGQINATRPELTRNVIRILTQVHLAAEIDERLTRSEKEALSSAIDVFERRIKEMTFNPKNSDSNEEGYVYIGRFYGTCCNQRVIHGFESLISEVLKSGLEFSRNLELVRLVFNRLKSLNWMQGLKSKLGPLGAKILQKIESTITVEVDDDHWCELMKTVSVVVQSMTSSAKSIDGLMQNALCKLQSMDTSDNCRLMASESLAMIASRKKDPQLHFSAMLLSVLRFVHGIVNLMLKPYEEESLEAQMMVTSTEGIDYGLSVEGLDKASIKELIKVFAGSIDLLERLLTTSRGLHWIPIDQILSICFRISSMNGHQLNSRNSGTLHSFEMMSILPGMQIIAWKILKCILSMNCKILLKHFRKITQILNHALQDFDSTSVQVSCSLYQTTGQYLRLTGLAGVSNVSKSVIQALKSEFQEYIRSSKDQDFQPIRKKARTTGKRKKTKEIEHLAAEVELFLSQKSDPKNTGSIKRHPSQQSIIQLVSQLLELGSNIIPFDEFQILEALIGEICIHCRKMEAIQVEIYSLLRNCITTTTRYRSRLLSMSVWMFQEGCNAASGDTRVYCRRALLDLDLLMHPRSLAMRPPIVELETKVALEDQEVDGVDVSAAKQDPCEGELDSSPVARPMELDSDDDLPEIDSGESD